MSDVQNFINSSLRAEVKSMLALFPENQTSLFARVFPGGIDNANEEKLRDALALCYRTHKSNVAKALAALPSTDDCHK